MCTTATGSYDLLDNIVMHTYTSANSLFSFFEEVGALDNLSSPEETNQS